MRIFFKNKYKKSRKICCCHFKLVELNLRLICNPRIFHLQTARLNFQAIAFVNWFLKLSCVLQLWHFLMPSLKLHTLLSRRLIIQCTLQLYQEHLKTVFGINWKLASRKKILYGFFERIAVSKLLTELFF